MFHFYLGIVFLSFNICLKNNKIRQSSQDITMNIFNYLYADSWVAFKVVCLHSITLSELLLPLPRTLLEPIWRMVVAYSQVIIFGPTKWSTVLGVTRSSKGSSLDNTVDGPILLSVFGQSKCTVSRHIAIMQDQVTGHVDVFPDFT
jgi:hypothetical protein